MLTEPKKEDIATCNGTGMKDVILKKQRCCGNCCCAEHASGSVDVVRCCKFPKLVPEWDDACIHHQYE